MCERVARRSRSDGRTSCGRHLSTDATASLVLFLTASLAIFAAPQVQNPASAPTSSTAPSRAVFRGGVEYVSVDVVVTDHDKPVTDLTAKEFQIAEGGRPQTILDFQHVSVPNAHRKIDLRANPGPSPDVATNLPVPPSGRAFVFVLDDGAMRPEDLTKVKRVMTQFLEELTPSDRVAVIFIHRSDLGQDFTNDTGLLIRAVNNLRGAVGWSPDARATRLVLANTIALLADAPEARRAVVYVSSGFEICPNKDVPVKWCIGLDAYAPNGPPPAFTQMGLDDLFVRAARADVPIYTLDPQGLEAPALNFTGHLEDQTPQNRRAADLRQGQLQDFVRLVASNTGGLAFTNTNDLAGSVDGIMADNGDYYVLGYSPSPYTPDNTFHSIEVTVPNRRGIQIRGRKGYVAAAPLTTSAGDAGKLLHAVSEAQPQTDLPLRAFIAPVAHAASGETSILTLDVSYPSVTADDDLRVEFVASDTDGRVLRSQPRTYHVPLATSAMKAPLTVSFDDAMALPRGQWILVIGVESQMLGKIGTLHLPVNADVLGSPGIAVSPLVLGYSERPMTAPIVANPQSIANVIPVQPITVRSFASNQRLSIFARVFAAKPSDIRTELKLSRDGSAIKSLPVSMASVPGLTSANDCTATLELSGLSPGNYSLDFTAKASGKQITRSVGFAIQ